MSKLDSFAITVAFAGLTLAGAFALVRVGRAEIEIEQLRSQVEALEQSPVSVGSTGEPAFKAGETPLPRFVGPDRRRVR